MWRYSLRWRYPHIPCSGKPVLASEDVCEGAPVPDSILSRFIAGGDYAVCLDFLSERPVKRWPPERKAQARLRNLRRRILKNAPLFADELISRELALRPEYFNGH